MPIFRWRENQWDHIATPLPVEPKVGETYRLKVVAEGQNYQCFIDDELLFDDKDDANSETVDASALLPHTANVHYDNLDH